MALEEFLDDFVVPAAPRRGGARNRCRWQRIRVQEELLRAPIPSADEIKDALSAKAAVAEAAMEPLRALLRANSIDEDSDHKCVTEVERRWDQLLQTVRCRHLTEVVKELGQQTKVKPFQLDLLAKERFLLALRIFNHCLTVSYHGTEERNLESIAEKGLLVPGEGGVKVAHGSAHGVGVYTARIGAAWLSKGFCNSGKLLLCAVCDTSVPVSKEKEGEAPKPAVAYRPVTRKSDQVIHVGDAVVVFNSECVAPLFVVDTKPAEGEREDTNQPKQQVATIGKCEWRHHALVPIQDTSWSWPQQIGRRRIAAPVAGKTIVKFGGEDKVGEEVWLPALPLESATRQQRRLKRIREQLRWQQPRRMERERKRASAEDRADCYLDADPDEWGLRR